jgi:hypothetical protein
VTLGATVTFVLVACAGKVDHVGGESHFVCMSDHDCPSSQPVCVKADSESTRGECRQAVSGGAGTTAGPADASTDQGVGGSNGVGGSDDGAGGSGDGGNATGSGGAAGSGVGNASGRSSGGAGNASGSGGRAGGGADNTGGAPNGGPLDDPSCVGECCPSDVSCYSSTQGKDAPGAACLARIQNTSGHIQMRQTWVNVTAPAGNTIPIVLKTLNTYSQLKEPACNTPDGASGYMHALDLDLTGGVATFGYTKYVADTASTLRDGVCFADVGSGVDTHPWTDISDYGTLEQNYDFSLPADQMSPSTDYPEGLPAPMPQPWTALPTKSKRLTTDFDVTIDRAMILRRLAKAGDLGKQGYTGVFFYDAASGVAHSYAPVSYQVMYDAPAVLGATPSSFVVIPMREEETRYRVNDPMNPNCIGRYRPDNLDPQAGCIDPGMTGTGPTNKNAWGGIFDTTTGSSDAATRGYYLITELEQVFSRVLQMTLCVSFPTLDVSIQDGWATMTEKRCRKSSKWNPSDPVNGLPHGDWCAATNSPATSQCHDAYRGTSFQAYQAFKVKSAHCPVL